MRRWVRDGETNICLGLAIRVKFISTIPRRCLMDVEPTFSVSAALFLSLISSISRQLMDGDWNSNQTWVQVIQPFCFVSPQFKTNRNTAKIESDQFSWRLCVCVFEMTASNQSKFYHHQAGRQAGEQYGCCNLVQNPANSNIWNCKY